MDLDRLNQWLTLAASVGVIIGLIFLIVEINQSNRIASYAAEPSRRNQFIELNSVGIENSQIVAKLQAGDMELSPPERAQALMMAKQLLNTWKDAEAAYDHGLLSDETFHPTIRSIKVTVQESPGLTPFLAYLVDVYKLADESSLVSQKLDEEVTQANE